MAAPPRLRVIDNAHMYCSAWSPNDPGRQLLRAGWARRLVLRHEGYSSNLGCIVLTGTGSVLQHALYLVRQYDYE